MKRMFVFFATVILILSIAVPFLAPPSKVSADTNVSVSILSNETINAFLDLVANNGNTNVWINGVPLSGIISQGISAAVRQSVPNGQYSGASSPGWQGWFGITSNDAEIEVKGPDGNTSTLFVYTGAGCGGAYGTSDGWPDFWVRRNFIGLMAYTLNLESELKITQDAIVKLIEFSGNQEKINKDLATDVQGLQQEVEFLKERILTLEELEKQNIDRIESSLEQKTDRLDNLTIWLIVVSSLLVILIGVILLLYIRTRK